MAAPTTSQPGSEAQAYTTPDVIVTDVPKLDLDLYIQNYVGRTRYERLILIGKCCVPLRVEALKAAVAEAKSGSDITRYNDACALLRAAAPDDPDAQRDDAWIENTEIANRNETARLETELKGYRNNLIKESIRMGNEDLGKHFESIGRLSEATEAYNKMRHDVSTTKHIFDCGMHLASVAFQRHDWATVLSNVGKISNIQSGDDEQEQQAYTKVASGVALMGMGNFHDAAMTLIHTNPNVSPTEYSTVASPNDVAIYGGLLSLATMDRTALQSRILDNQSFRTFLEHEPHIRKAISLFVNGRYSTCLSILESVRADYLLDIYLQPHVPAIYSLIREKCIVQYFIPFSCVTLDSLDAAFGKHGQSVEPELIRMIRDGSLKARIDAKNKLLVAVSPDPRLVVQTNALHVARKYELEAKERLRRMNIIAAGLEVIGVKKPQTGGVGGPEPDEAWFEENRMASYLAEREAQGS
ncbi:hypothetical protein ACSS6W_008293 [Trichoderma asperelloides]|uniref:COP9 signalosome complex subunit 1 n=1 Tax=Trichoderma asperellum TaxID=101201 RepID=A0A6V8R254_TRIAP|nr:COP9 signalosome complex subunit 1 [Trichoderma asperellum]